MTTNADLTLIAVLVDRSGSMAQWREDMEGGLNAFVESQASEPGDAEITLAQFDTKYELVWPLCAIKDAPEVHTDAARLHRAVGRHGPVHHRGRRGAGQAR